MNKRKILLALALIMVGCKKEENPSNRLQSVPVVQTTQISNINNNSASGGGNVISDGGSTVSFRGVCWSLSPNPTISESLTVDGGGIGVYQSQVEPLLAGTNYYIRSYAINSSGIGYGNQLQFTTQSSNNYPIITLNGSNVDTLFLQENYIELGASAYDIEDGNLQVVISGTVNTDSVGIYTMIYTASDSNNNTSMETKEITVLNQSFPSQWSGNYNCTWGGPGIPNYYCTDGIFVSRTLNNALNFLKFGDYGNNDKWIHFFINGNLITIPSQTITAGTPPQQRTFSGSGTLQGTGAVGSQILMSVTESSIGGSQIFNVVYVKY